MLLSERSSRNSILLVLPRSARPVDWTGLSCGDITGAQARDPPKEACLQHRPVHHVPVIRTPLQRFVLPLVTAGFVHPIRPRHGCSRKLNRSLEPSPVHAHHRSAEVPRFGRSPVRSLVPPPARLHRRSPRTEGLRRLEQTLPVGRGRVGRGGEGSEPSQVLTQPAVRRGSEVRAKSSPDSVFARRLTRAGNLL